MPYSGGDGLTGRVGGTAPGYDSLRVRGTAWHGFVFDLGAYMWEQRAHEGLERGGVFARGGVWPSSEAESHPRGRPALERGGNSPEGASSPRARRNLTRGGDQPSSEAESHPRGRPALERDRVLSV
jgi:hypothetical protein